MFGASQFGFTGGGSRLRLADLASALSDPSGGVRDVMI
jgi:hypothetical protein